MVTLPLNLPRRLAADALSGKGTNNLLGFLQIAHFLMDALLPLHEALE
jgi:hypothetical protein